MEGYDSSAEGLATARRRKILDEMMRTTNASALVGRSGPSQAIVKMLTNVLLDRQQGQVDEQDKTQRATYGQELGNETNQYLDRMTGKPGQQMNPEQVDALMNQDQAPQLADPVAANPREAITRALTSQKPEMRALGNAGMQEQLKSLAAKRAGSTMSQKDFLTLGDMTPESRIAAALAGDPAMLKGTKKEHVVNGQIVRSSGEGSVEPAGDLRDKFGPDEVVQGTVIQRVPGTGEARTVAPAPPVGQTINIDNVGANVAIKGVAPALEKAVEGMNSAYTNIQTAERMYQLASDPAIISGFGGGVAKGLASVASKLGFIGPDGVNKTDAILTEMAATTLAAGQKMKGSFSDADIKFLKEVTAGSIERNAEVLRHVAGLALAANHNALFQADNQYNSASSVDTSGQIQKLSPKPKFSYKVPEGKEFSVNDAEQMTYNSPLYSPKAKAGAAAPGATMTLEEYLKKK